MTSDAAPEGVRLQKVLASLGFGSRRIVEDLIEEGRVVVNGEQAVLGRRIDTDRDSVEVDGVPVGVAPGLVYYLLNKPAGVVSTAADTHGRAIVTELVPEEPRVYPVGRLDLETEGLLLLTNDGDLTHRLTHPSFGVEKEYIAELDGEPKRGDLRKLREGIELEDGMTSPAKASLIAPNVLRLTIHEGRNRQVRRMCSALGFEVTRLVRSRIGSVADRRLAPGEWRELEQVEVRKLSELATAKDSR
jgi:23S rRNA pseudouridine2605 synthase